MSIPPVPNADGSIPEPAAPVEAPATAAAPVETPAAETTAPEAPPAPAAAPAPWAADLAERFTDDEVRAKVDAYLREKQQPYITKLEQERAEALDKAWVFDGLNEDPAATLREIAEQVYDADVAARIAELVGAGASVEKAETQAVAEANQEPDPEAVDLSALPPEVREAVEWAKTERERQAAQEAKDAEAAELAEAKTVYDEWRAQIVKDNPDVIESDLHAYVYAADGDLDQGFANYRAAHPAPKPEPEPEPPTTLGGGGSSISPTRPASNTSLADAMGAVYDGVAGTAL